MRLKFRISKNRWASPKKHDSYKKSLYIKRSILSIYLEVRVGGKIEKIGLRIKNIQVKSMILIKKKSIIVLKRRQYPAYFFIWSISPLKLEDLISRFFQNIYFLKTREDKYIIWKLYLSEQTMIWTRNKGKFIVKFLKMFLGFGQDRTTSTTWTVFIP